MSPEQYIEELRLALQAVRRFQYAYSLEEWAIIKAANRVEEGTHSTSDVNYLKRFLGVASTPKEPDEGPYR